MTSTNISKTPDQLITDILNYTQQTVVKTRRAKLSEDEVAALFQKVGQAMKELAEALPDNSWKLRYLTAEIQDVRRQIEQEAPSLEKALPAFLRRIRDTANNIFRTLHPTPAGIHFIREGDLPLVRKEKDEICRNKAGGKQLWTIIDRNIKADKPDVVAAIVASGNCLKLAPFQVMQIWDWAGDRFEVIGSILSILWVPPKQLGRAVDQALQQNRFAVVAEPVIVHHFGRLSIPLQKRVQQWAQERFPSAEPKTPTREDLIRSRNLALLDNLADLASRLVIFLKRNSLQHKDPTPPAGSLQEQLSRYTYQLNFAFMTLLATNIRTHEKVEEAHALWKTLRQDLQQDPLPLGVIQSVEKIVAAVDAFPNIIRVQEEEFDGAESFVLLSPPPDARPSGYGSMGSTSVDKKKTAQLRSEQMFSTLKIGFEADDPDVVMLDCMGFLLLEPPEFEALFAIACTKERSRVMERLWTLPPFSNLGPDHYWAILKIFLSNRRYPEAEKILRIPSFCHVKAKVFEISDLLKPDAPEPLTTCVSELVAQYLATEEAPSNILETNLKALAAFLAQTLLNNGWLKDAPPEPAASEEFLVKVWLAYIDRLLSAIPKDVKKPSVIAIQTKVWPALKADLEKDDLDLRAVQARFEEMMEQMYHFRKPLPEDEYEAKSEERDPLPRWIADFQGAVQLGNLTAIKREMEKLFNHMEQLTPAIASQVVDMLAAIPVDGLVLLAREELGDQATESSIQASVSQFFDMIQLFRTSFSIPKAPPVPSGLVGGDSGILSALMTDIQQQNWAEVQRRVETFFQTATANDRSTIMAIGKLLAPTPLEDLKMMITMQLLD